MLLNSRISTIAQELLWRQVHAQIKCTEKFYFSYWNDRYLLNLLKILMLIQWSRYGQPVSDTQLRNSHFTLIVMFVDWRLAPNS